MAHDPVHDEDVAEIAHLTAEAASAYIRGDIRRYLTFIRHADDYTLLPPFGGEPRRGFDSSDEALEALAQPDNLLGRREPEWFCRREPPRLSAARQRLVLRRRSQQ